MGGLAINKLVLTWHHLEQPNRGQMIKEFLAEQGIAAARTTERSSRAPRQSKKRLSGGVSVTSYSCYS